jgi:hypothetical protein
VPLVECLWETGHIFLAFPEQSAIWLDKFFNNITGKYFFLLSTYYSLLQENILPFSLESLENIFIFISN